MLLQIQLPNHDESFAFNRQRWAEVLADPQWDDCPGRIETNGFGQIIMTPPAGGMHSDKQGQLVYQLRQRLGNHVLPECPILTMDGVKAADIGWFSPNRYVGVRGQSVFEVAPEICVEVLSPRNTPAEMQAKRQLYFSAGALECWICDLDGNMAYYDRDQPETPLNQSKLVPEFPSFIQD